jgi:hypothetical protein
LGVMLYPIELKFEGQGSQQRVTSQNKKPSDLPAS